VLYYREVRRIDPGVRIPFGYVARCIAGAMPAVIMLPLLAAVPGALGLAAAAVAGAAAIALGYRMARVVGPEEVSILRRVPAPGMASVVNWLGRSSS
jgi:hypothetical protein